MANGGRPENRGRVERRGRGGGARTRDALAALTFAVSLLVAAACSPPQGSILGVPDAIIGRWTMNEAGGSVMTDSSGAGRHGTIGSGVARGGGVYFFPGWSANVDGSGRLIGRVLAAAGLVTVADRGGALQPGRGPFTVSLRLRSALTASGRLPAGSGASFNIVQKGRADQRGGFWKLELAGDGDAAGRVRWVVSDGVRTAVATSRVRVDDGRWHSIVAERRGDRLVLAVDGASATVAAGQVGDVGPGDPPVSIGKKPGSTDPRDAFAGWLDELTIAR